LYYREKKIKALEDGMIRETNQYISLGDDSKVELPTVKAGLPPNMNPEQVAHFLGRSSRTIRRWLAEGMFPDALYINSRWTIPREYLDCFLATYRITPKKTNPYELRR
jgi:hypothetical protein